MNLGTFFVDSVIVHDVPRRGIGVGIDDIVYSDVASDVDVELKNFFRERVVESLKRQAFAVEQDPNTTSPVPKDLAKIIAKPGSLVKRSQKVAAHLWACQTRTNPAGLLVFCLGRVDQKRAIGVLKLEREDAIRVQQVTKDGGQTFDIAHLQDLMLGKNTKVFKASLFVLDNGEINGLVSDDQRGYDSSSEIAQFFLEKFLGCKLKTANHLATKAFFEQSQAWINAEVDDGAKKARYEVALLAYMGGPAASISTRSFAQTGLDASDQTAYLAFMKANDVSSTTVIKDLQLIAKRVEQMTLATTAGLRISGLAATMDDLVDVETDGADGPVIQIRDTVEAARGGRS